MAWNATIGLCFLLWVVYSVTALIAGLDLRAQIQALTGTPPGPQPGASSVCARPRPAAPQQPLAHAVCCCCLLVRRLRSAAQRLADTRTRTHTHTLSEPCRCVPRPRPQAPPPATAARSAPAHRRL
jgi:hypothetical protein